MRCAVLSRIGRAKLATMLGLVPALAALALVVSAPTGAYVYWYGNKGIARATLSGGEVDLSLVPYQGDLREGIAVSNQYLYFGATNELIGRAALNGGDVDPGFIHILLPEQVIPSYADEARESLALGGGYIYWAGAHDEIGRASINASNVVPGFIQTESSVTAVAVDARHIYWAGGRSIGRASLDGSEVEPRFIRLKEGTQGIAVADGHIYWSGSEDIGRANLDGSGVAPQFIALPRWGVSNVIFSSLAAGGGYIYWFTAYAPGGMSWIGRAKLNGSGIQKTLINVTGDGFHGGLAADALGPTRAPRRAPKPKR
jgi:hypothetical protein